MRATLRLSSPAWLMHPMRTSSTSRRVHAGPVHERTDGVCREIVGPDAGQRPPCLPMGVRTASMIHAAFTPPHRSSATQTLLVWVYLSRAA